ncbi:MAG: hypothetical protein WD025_03770 [Bacteriovoracaceae bacterium]
MFILTCGVVLAAGPFGVDELFKQVPLLKSFRVPARYFIIISYALVFYAFYCLLDQTRSGPKNRIFYLIGLIILCKFVGLIVIEGLLLLATLGYALSALFKKHELQSFSIIVIALIALLNIKFFDENISVMKKDSERLSAQKLKILELVASKNPLNKYFIMNELTLPQKNTGLFFKIGNLDGYGFPGIRFIKLHSFLLDEPFNNQRVVYKSLPLEKHNVLNKMFRLKGLLSYKDSGWELEEYKNYPVRKNVKIHRYEDKTEL